ncbi:hypothetical protein GUJ93_ZPchr0007g4255 [Zizania palustris]|uniref:Uncharacterized protein n=1 Tax=Zizania palustris TaxID=103762 RepID=A0A8J5SS31_ZIZPA|nr:hypothetical protein GUJ93_ZPchr0007g4255 [Zizania palustris]
MRRDIYNSGRQQQSLIPLLLLPPPPPPRSSSSYTLDSQLRRRPVRNKDSSALSSKFAYEEPAWLRMQPR